MAEFAPVGMFIADSTGKITYSNDTWCKSLSATTAASNISQLQWGNAKDL
jgi:hypothetical protein